MAARVHVCGVIKLNICANWHLSQENEPWFRTSEICFVVLTWLIRVPGSKLIRSNNQSKSTRWVLETCLEVGLRMVILITASLSTKMNRDARWLRSVCIKGTKSGSSIHCFIPLLFDVCGFSLNVGSTLTVLVVLKHRSQCHPQAQCRNSIQTQTSVQRNDFSFCTSVRNSFLFLTRQPNWNKRVVSESTQNTPPDVDLESAKSPAMSASWHNPKLHCGTVFPTWQHCLNPLAQWTWPIAYHKLCSTSRLLLHKNSLTTKCLVFQSAPNKYMFRTICEHATDNSPTVFLFEWMVIKTRSENFEKFLDSCIRQFAVSFDAFLCVSFHVVRPRDRVAKGSLPTIVNDPRSVNTAYEPESSCTTACCIVWTFSNSEFVNEKNVHKRRKMNCLSCFVCLLNNFHLTLYYDSDHAGKFFFVSHSLFTSAFAITWGTRMGLCKRL